MKQTLKIIPLFKTLWDHIFDVTYCAAILPSHQEFTLAREKVLQSTLDLVIVIGCNYYKIESVYFCVIGLQQRGDNGFLSLNCNGITDFVDVALVLLSFAAMDAIRIFQIRATQPSSVV